MYFTTERTINDEQYEGVVDLYPGETDVYRVYVKGPNDTYYFYSPDRTIESEVRESPLSFGGMPGFSNDETQEFLEGLFESI